MLASFSTIFPERTGGNNFLFFSCHRMSGAGETLPACTAGAIGSPYKMAVQELMLSSDPGPLKGVLNKKQ